MAGIVGRCMAKSDFRMAIQVAADRPDFWRQDRSFDPNRPAGDALQRAGGELTSHRMRR